MRRKANRIVLNLLQQRRLITNTHHYHPFPSASYSTSAASSSTTLVSSTNKKIKDLLFSIVNVPTKAISVSHADLLHQLTSFLLGSSQSAATQTWEEPSLVFKLVELQKCGQEEVEEQARLCLALLGYAPPYAGRGLRILSIDGGGTR